MLCHDAEVLLGFWLYYIYFSENSENFQYEISKNLVK